MRLSIVQCDIIWEHKSANLMNLDSILSGLAGKTDLVILPEMCTTGFSMKTTALAEYDDGETITSFSRMAENYGFAISGTFIGKGPEGNTENKFYNRGFFLHPDGKKDFYNKRHLFRMGDEAEHFSAGDEKIIINYKGWNIRMIICYDLRFPVWARNSGNEYDLLLVSANWPQPRRHVWNTLLKARAIENMTFVCGVNRIGKDGMNIKYSGDSQLIDAYGNAIALAESEFEEVLTTEIDLQALKTFRDKFPAWKDADEFSIKI